MFNAVTFIADKINVLSTNIQQFNHQQYNIEMTIIILHYEIVKQYFSYLD